jgi:exopolysaccharide biosynthesis polyprenyl glycosylphosphotransferase
MRAIYKSFYIFNILIFIINTALYIALAMGINRLYGTPGRYLSDYVVFYIAAVLAVYAFHGYDFHRPREINRIIVSTAAGVIMAALVTIPFMIIFRPHMNKTAFTLLVAGTFFIASASRAAGAFCFRKWVPGRDVVVVGDETTWKPVIDEIKNAMQGKMLVSAWVNPTPKRLMELAAEKGYTSVIVADPKYFADEPIRETLAKLKDQGCQVEMLPKLVEQTLGRIPLEVAQAYKNYYEIAFQMVENDPRQRVADIVLSLAGIVIGLPIAAVIALAIWLDSGRPILFKQERVGKDGEIFTIHKFRTMKNRKEDDAGFVDDHACHITHVGKVLRKTRLDEIPQLWDVLRSKMSLVGPRPEQPEFEKQFAEEIPFYRYRRLVKPGITGWAQTKYPYAASVEETKKKLEYDLYYVKNRSLTLYLQIILWTAETMLTMRGAR